MIVITGPGRSGTSMIASLYRELGHDPGGDWQPGVNAGLELREVVELNEAIASDLSMTMLAKPGSRRSLHDYVGEATAKRVKALLPPTFRQRLHTDFDRLFWRRAKQLNLFDWARLLEVAESNREAIQTLSSQNTVTKDPRFAWTLPVWIAAGAEISDVIVTTRALESMVASRQASRLVSLSSESDIRNSLVYAVGMCLTSCWDNDISAVVLRYPDFMSDVAALQEKLPLLRDMSIERFRVAMEKIVRPDLIHY